MGSVLQNDSECNGGGRGVLEFNSCQYKELYNLIFAKN